MRRHVRSRRLQRAGALRAQIGRALDLAGCTCDPDIRHQRKGHLVLLHDPGCPAGTAPDFDAGDED